MITQEEEQINVQGDNMGDTQFIEYQIFLIELKDFYDGDNESEDQDDFDIEEEYLNPEFEGFND